MAPPVAATRPAFAPRLAFAPPPPPPPPAPPARPPARATRAGAARLPRRAVVAALAALACGGGGAAARGAPAPARDADAALAALRRVTALQDRALDLTAARRFADAEPLWDELVALDEGNAAAWSNRGNCRVSQGRFRDALADFDRAVALAPGEPDPRLGRGVALEALGEVRAAVGEFVAANERAVARYGAADPVALGNAGNAQGALGDWAAAAAAFGAAAAAGRGELFARANEAYALYEMGRTGEAVRRMRALARKYPAFVDVRAALVAVRWSEGRAAEAETLWAAVLGDDARYRDGRWLREVRRWPPALRAQLDDFQRLRRAPPAPRPPAGPAAAGGQADGRRDAARPAP